MEVSTWQPRYLNEPYTPTTVADEATGATGAAGAGAEAAGTAGADAGTPSPIVLLPA